MSWFLLMPVGRVSDAIPCCAQFLAGGHACAYAGFAVGALLRTVYVFAEQCIASWLLISLFCFLASAFSVSAPTVSAWWEVRPVAFRRCGWSRIHTPPPAGK